jgi:integrase
LTAKKKYADIITPESLSAFAPHTQRQYTGAWRTFLRWSKKTRRREILPLTSKDLMAYLQDLADQGRKWATIQVHKSTILKAHRRAGLPNPADNDAFTDELRNLARAIGKHQTQMTGLTEACVEAIAATAHIPRITRGAQTELPRSAQRRANFDLALIHTMRDGLLRSSEASNLLWRDLETYQDGTGRVLVRRSKTDQSGEGSLLYLSRTAVTALHLIRPKNPPPGERIFPLSTDRISNRIKLATAAAGLTGNFGGHSPRIGMAVDLAQSGAGLPEIQQAGRWQDANMPARYIRGITAGQGAVARFSAARGR